MKIGKKGMIKLLSVWINFCFMAPLIAGEPLIISSTGVPYKWDNSAPIPFNPDGGDLGMLSNTSAINFIMESFQAWADISSATISFTNAGQITDSLGTPLNIDITNFGRIISKSSPTGQNEIVFDETGEIFNALFGRNSGILGFAGPDFITTDSPYFITEGSAFMNGMYVDGNRGNGELTLGEMKAVFVHEFGHFLNLAHTQVNGLAFLSNENIQGFGSPPTSSVETMYPFIVDSTMMTPHADDIAVFSSLYPASPANKISAGQSNYLADTGTISGKVYFRDGITPANGVNVIARNTSGGAATIFDDAVSQISGAFSEFDGDGSSNPDFQGKYSLAGLTPGADYSVEIDQIGEGGFSSLTLIPLPGPEEFYNGTNESGDSQIDEKSEISLVTPIAGTTISNIDIILNDEIRSLVLDKFDDSIESAINLSQPNGQNDYIAVRHSVPASVDTPFTVSSIRFYNNDNQTIWPLLMVTSAHLNEQPDLVNPLAVFTNISGPADDFIEINTNIKITSLEALFVVVKFPPGVFLTTPGAGGGSGIGVDTDLTLGFISGNLFSLDGVTFNELKGATRDVNLAIELTLDGTQRTDILEPNDNMASATPINYGSKGQGYIDIPGDLDYYSFSGSAGEFIQFDVAAITLGSTLDGYVTLLNSAGTVIAQNDDEIPQINIDPLLETVLPETGTYFLVIDTFENNQQATPVGGANLFYEFTLNKVQAVPRLTHSTGKVDFTLWSNGIYGDDGNATGNGFSFMGKPGATLFSGGFLAVTPTKIAGNIPSFNNIPPNNQTLLDFVEVRPFTSFASNSNFSTIAECEFAESGTNVFNSPIGISVKQTSYSNTNDSFVLVECKVTNKTGEAMSNLYLGQFGDWDVGIDNFNSNSGGYDTARYLIYQFEAGSNPNDSFYYGIKALQPASGARVTSVLDESSLFGFISNFNGPGPNPITTNNDYRSFIGSGPFELERSASITVGFAWIGGTNFSNLQANADAAQSAWELVVGVEETPVAFTPARFSLEQNYPNPFNPSTKIKYAIAEDTQVSLIVYNMLGQLVRTLVDEKQNRDFYEVEWDGRNDAGIQLASGVYFYKLSAGKKVKVRKMLLIR